MTQAKTVMVQGTGSSVGKSMMVAALCRMLRQDGYRVAPFKAQNMSLNSFVTKEGGEIGRAQAVQAEAAGIEPTVHMNPILLKPESDCRSQVVVRGKPWKTSAAREYWRDTAQLLDVVAESLAHLRQHYDVVVIEGAGSPAEVNLREHEIVNMRVARLAGAPVLLVGDIDRGGVFASLVGTLELLTPEERRHVKGLIINKFRGDPALLMPGVEMVEKRTGKPCLGVVPYIPDLSVAQEDGVYLDDRPEKKVAVNSVDVAVICLPYMSNYDDFDPLGREGCSVRYVSTATELGLPDLIILPGTKTTIADLQQLRRSGIADAIVRRHRCGTPIIGICGGYQMLGQRISDPEHVESDEGEVAGLGLLDVYTVFEQEKRTIQVSAVVAGDSGVLAGLQGLGVEGYEIHQGSTIVVSGQPAFRIHRTPDGASDHCDGCLDNTGRVMGTYIHGLFNNEDFTVGLLTGLSGTKGNIARRDTVEWRQREYDRLADTVRSSLNMKAIYDIVSQGMNA